MSREYCEVCSRALKGCICRFTTKVSNNSPVTILRHPSEIKNLKGTAQILSLSLTNIRLFDGETFNEEDILKPNLQNILIFPSDKSINTDEFICNNKKESEIHFIFIDGTWKKAYKILQLNPYLKDITHINLQVDSESPYAQVRKQKSGGLSTLEAVICTLKNFEDGKVFGPLEKSFDDFIKYLKSLST